MTRPPHVDPSPRFERVPGWRSDAGGALTEYLALLLVVALVVAGFGASGLGSGLGERLSAAVCQVLGSGDCAQAGDPGDPGHPGDPGEPADPGGDADGSPGDLEPDGDADGDGVSNEVAAGTDPQEADSDEDGLPDGAEAALGTDPNVFDQEFPLPGVPDPPPPPAEGDGSGEHGGRDAGIGDRIAEQLAGALATAAEVLGHTDAARHLRHYLANSGENLEVDTERVIADVAAAQAQVDAQLDGVLADHADAIADAAASGERVVIPFTTEWGVATADQGSEANWFYALGSFSLSQTGVIVVEPGPDGQPVVRVEYQTHLFDRYNWDAGKSVTIGPVTIEDQQLQDLHETGLAQEFDVYGSTDTQVIEVDVADLDVDPPVPDPGRDGDREDPGRGRGGRDDRGGRGDREGR